MSTNTKTKETQKKADEKRKGKRTRNWACLAYPESAVEGWQDRLAEKCIPCFVSPLHDSDVWTAYDETENPEHKAGTPKKAHYHIMFMFSSVKTKEQVEELTKSLGFTSVIKVEDAKAYARYLCHLGCNDKHIYSTDDVLQFGGTDYHELIESTASVMSAIAEMEEWCEEQGITSYNQLSRYCRRERPDLYRVLIYNGRHIEKVLKSREWELKKERQALELARMEMPETFVDEAEQEIKVESDASDCDLAWLDEI